MNMLAEMTGLQKFIESHQEGYEYYLQPAGNHLSGRVIKRILLMRALIHNPLLLLLEEPWLGLEQEYAENIQQYLLHTLADKTVIVASNDQSFAAKCDYVFLMDEGTITSIRKK